MTHLESRVRREKIAEYVRAGHSIGEAMVRFGVRYSTAWDAAGPVGSSKKTAPSSFRILKLMLEGAKNRKLADEFGVSKQRIDQIRSLAIEAGFRFPKAQK